jgi:hypothetical protein
MQAQIRTLEQQVSSATIWRLFSPEDSRLVGVRYTQHAGVAGVAMEPILH